MSSIRPLGRRILLERITKDNSEVVVGGIIIPPKYDEALRENFIEMRVKALGDAPQFEVKVGDVVLVHRLHGHPWGPDGHDVIIMEQEALVIIERSAA